MKDLVEKLKEGFGLDSFRGQQKEIVESILNEESHQSLVLMPTGGGKSLCYLLPSYLTPKKLTLVVSPLISLMKDQVDGALQNGLKATFINSSLSKEERSKRHRLLKEKAYQIIFVSPERFKKKEFWEAVEPNEVNLVAVDEAHCIAQWGNDFRPEYKKLYEYFTRLGTKKVMALTATATPEMQEEIAGCLKFDSSFKTFDQGIKRPEIKISVQPVVGLDEKFVRFISFSNTIHGAKVLYFSLIDTLEKFSLLMDKQSIPHYIYHGRMDPRKRSQQQNNFLKDDNGVMLATPAFGLGINKKDIRAVFHGELPRDLESYYQELGRAGRDGESAQAIMFYDSDDISIQLDFIKWSNPQPEFIISTYNILRKNIEIIRQQGFDFIKDKLLFYHKRDFRLNTTLTMFKSLGVTNDYDRHKHVNVIGDIPEFLLDEENHKTKLLKQNKKLLKLVEYAKSETCRKQLIFEYFGMQDEPVCGTCDICLKVKNEHNFS